MNKPCEHCDRADNRRGYFECDNPCELANKCYKSDEDFIKKLFGDESKLEEIERIIR